MSNGSGSERVRHIYRHGYATGWRMRMPWHRHLVLELLVRVCLGKALATQVIDNHVCGNKIPAANTDLSQTNWIAVVA